MAKENEMIIELHNVLFKHHGETSPIVHRLREISDGNKKEIVNGLEAIISELKTGDLKADSATKQTIKHVYRQITQ